MTDTSHLGPAGLDHGAAGFPGLPELQAQLRDGRLTSVSLTRRCLERIELVDPLVNAVLAVDESALEQAARADRRYAAGAERGPLDGIPVLVKDNIDTAGLAGSAGSRLLAGHPPARDARVVAGLRAAGAVVLGKTNLSEWSNFRSTQATEGWSGVGGQTRNPYRLDRSPGGSSAGSAVAVATGMAPLALGTETDGSIVGPAGLCGVVGVKPETGLLPLDGVVPITPELDSVGVLASRLSDAALALSVLGGQTAPEPDPGMLRVGVWRVPRMPGVVDAVLDSATQALRSAGIAVVPVELALDQQTVEDGLLAMYAEFRPALEQYLAGRPGGPRTLAELIEGNRSDPVELSLFGQDLFEQAQLIGPGERERAVPARQRSRDAARRLLDRTMRRYGVQALLAPTNEPAPVLDYELGDPGTPGSSTPAALAGYPNVSLPVGQFRELPLGVSVFGPPTLARLLPVALRVAEACAVRRTPALLP
ncbi:amidase family protein [Kitasatospora sp. NPDC001664]